MNVRVILDADGDVGIRLTSGSKAEPEIERKIHGALETRRSIEKNGSMLQQPAIVVAIFSLCGVLFGAALQFFFGRALESRKQLTLQRSQAYVDYFKTVALIAQNGRSREILALAADAKTRICIYGSPAVVTQLHVFETSGANTNSAAGVSAIVQLLREMRNDIGKDNRAIDDAVVQSVLFGTPRA